MSNTLTITQMKKLLRLLKANHEKFRDMQLDCDYDNSMLCKENLQAIEFLSRRIGQFLNEG